MSDTKNILQCLVDLLHAKAKPVIEISPISQRADPTSDTRVKLHDSVLALVDGKCGAIGAYKYGDITTYYIVSNNKIIINQIEYATVFVMQEKEGADRPRIATALSNVDSFYVRCDNCVSMIQPVGYNPYFFTDLKACKITTFGETNQQGIFVKQETSYNIGSTMEIRFPEEGGITIGAKN